MTKAELLSSLRQKGFDKKIIAAFDNVRREDFIPENNKKFAYEDTALSIGYGQTISQPYTIAFMLALLEIKDNLKILEVGAGSGYVLALLNQLSKNSQIFGTEIVKELVDRSSQEIIYTPDTLGLKPKAPFDRILVSAAANKLPEKLVDQLAEGGVIVCPVNNSIIKAWKQNGKLKIEEHFGFAFVPLIISAK